MTESFVFYESYLKGIESLSKKSQLNLFLAVTRYALRDEDPMGLTAAERGVFELIKPTIDANAKRRANAVKGGRPKNKKPTDIFFDKKIKPNENETDNNNYNGNVNDHKTEKDYSVVTLSDEERAALVEMSDNLTVENYINSLRNWQISNRKLISKPYVLIKRFIEEDAESRKKNPHFTSASKSQSFTVERLERLVKTYNDRNADSLGDEKPDVLL